MQVRNILLNNFANNIKMLTVCCRPDDEGALAKLFGAEDRDPFVFAAPGVKGAALQSEELSAISDAAHVGNSLKLAPQKKITNLLKNKQTRKNSYMLLARGNGLSYNDCCFNHDGIIVDMGRLNHLLSFDKQSGILICQGSTTFADLFLVSPNFIPPVIPGTIKATVAGGIAHDIHGKNNGLAGSFGRHIQWLDLLLSNKQLLRCSPHENVKLFYATIAGLGLTGIITRIAIKMTKASHFVAVQTEKNYDFTTLIARMQQLDTTYEYQVAWLDLIKERSILSLANSINHETINRTANCIANSSYQLPKLPFPLINFNLIKLLNQYYFHKTQPSLKILPLKLFNNPLDLISNYGRLYGKNGFIQFQAVFSASAALETIQELMSIINATRAQPTLAVLKLFSQAGTGLLSFVQPGFTIAIDFINNDMAHKAILTMNKLITKINGKIYLAKDLFLTAMQFSKQYPNCEQFKQIIAEINSQMRSDLSRRLKVH